MGIYFPYQTTICYVVNNRGKVLLQKKRRGFGQGKWNGPGGKLDPGETMDECAVREVREETGVWARNLTEMAYLEFVFPSGQENSNNCSYVYVCRDWEGEPEDKGEGELKWFKTSALPLDLMWDDDRYWLPQVLLGEYISKRFYFDRYGKVANHINI